MKGERPVHIRQASLWVMGDQDMKGERHVHIRQASLWVMRDHDMKGESLWVMGDLFTLGRRLCG